MTTGISPYVVPLPTDTDPSATVFETEIVAAHTMVDIGGGVMAMAETFNGAIPGPTFFLNVGDTVIVRLINELDHPLTIHWHGIELANSADGTEVTQAGAPPAFGAPPPPPAPIGGTYLYKFKVPRPGLYWYHPHSHGSTNRVFRGLYGMIVVSDPNETALIAANVIPAAADTKQIVLSDITVCKAPGSNDAATYDPTLPWAGPGGVLPAQQAPFPVSLCEIAPPPGDAKDEDGNPAAVSYAAGDVPSLIRTGPTNEGQTVLTNGMNVGGRAGTPSAPGALAGGAVTLPVQTGQRLRLQIANCATIRYFRLRLTTNTGALVNLVRIGGEGGLLDNARVEGGTIAGFNTKYDSGEILLPAGSRADVVATIPVGATNLTLWTEDYQRTGPGPMNPTNWANLPTVPVMHLNVGGVAAASPAIVDGTALLVSIGQSVETLSATGDALLNLPSFPAAGTADADIEITTPPGINGVSGSFETVPYPNAPHIASSRWAEAGDTLELTVTNTSQAHHPFHLHGFSFQPISLTRPAFPSFTWPYREFRDNIDIPGNYTLTFRVRLDDRELVDGVTMGGALGRWLFHCHIFFHHHQGMISELVVSGADGSEKPNIDVHGSWAYAGTGGTVTRTGTYQHPDGIPVTLSASLGTILPAGPVMGPGTWTWSYSGPDQTTYVYATATDAEGRSDQTVFRIRIGGMNDGADNGDPHIHTVDGNRYDFQAAGEFTLLRDADDGMEVQARQTPVLAANPITDPYSGLRTCVSINTAVAARVGRHRIAYQPTRDPKQLQLFLDGKPIEIPWRGLDLGEHRLSAQQVSGGAVAIRVDYANQAVLIVTPHFWTSYGVWYLNVSVANTQADRGIMGRIPADTWLPALPNGSTVGPMPADLQDRYLVLYRTFADAWRVTGKTSLFVYDSGTSTETFTDRGWPAEKPPCKLLPQFEVPGANPPQRGMSVKEAEKVCSRVTIDGLRQDCVFDVATTGDKEYALGYELAQELRLRATTVQVLADKPRSTRGEEVRVTATVSNLYRDAKEPPQGELTFFVDGKEAGREKLDERSSASIVLRDLALGEHRIRAEYGGGGECGHQASSSPNLLHVVARDTTNQPQREDQLLPHTFRLPTAGGKYKQVEVDLDVKTARRILAFLNAATRPEDLMQPPEVLTHLHVEYRKRGFPETHPPVQHEPCEKCERCAQCEKHEEHETCVNCEKCERHEEHDLHEHGSCQHGTPEQGAHDHGGHDHGAHDHGAHDHGAHDHGDQDLGGHDHGTHDRAKVIDEKLATEVLTRRNENPVYGYTRISEVLDIARLRNVFVLWWYWFSRASKGEWTGPFNIPVGGFDRPVHAAVLRTGKVLFWGLPTGKDSWLWTPNGATAGTTAPTANKPGDSLFCAGHAFLSDGRLLVAGGGGDGTGPRHNHGWIFDPVTESWTRTAGNGTPGNGDMSYHRWYPTLVTMGDEPGRVLVVSGDDTSGTDVRQMEMYMETTDRFELVWGPAGVGDTSAEHSFPQIYPAMNLLPGGEVFYTPTGWHSGGCSGAADYPAAKPSGFFEFASTAPTIKASWTDVGTQDAAAEATIDRVKGMAVLILQPSYPFVQALVVGGGKDPESAATFQMINLSTLVPKWGPPVTLPDGLARVNVNLVALPDGTVFVSGGRPLAGTPADGGACWIYNPVTMTWQQCDAVSRRRGYHSVAFLLPDGRVATAGNECPSDTTYEVFTPPYLFTSSGFLAPRPVITSLPAQVHHGHTFTIQTPSPSTIAKVVLVRPMAVTHQTDSEQRVVQLNFVTSGATSLSATAPNGWHPHGLAPRGWYMVFLVNNQGVPSVGQFMHLH